jgi:hypothetical protein
VRNHRSLHRERRGYPWGESAILLIAAIGGYAIKLPFGLLANRYLAAPGTPTGFTAWGLVLMALQLIAVVAGLAVYKRIPLPGAPWLERRLGRADAVRRPLWRPALIGVLICLLVTIVVSVAAAHLGAGSKLGSQIRAPSLPRSVLVTLAALYPFATIGAALSEEMVYRLGLISVLIWLFVQLWPRAKASGVLLFWLPVILVGLLFGYVHVAENVEAVQLGGPIISTLIAPQTWAGVVFGYLFCAYGLEAAIVCHAATDLAAPFVLFGLGQLLHRLG